MNGSIFVATFSIRHNSWSSEDYRTRSFFIFENWCLVGGSIERGQDPRGERPSRRGSKPQTSRRTYKGLSLCWCIVSCCIVSWDRFANLLKIESTILVAKASSLTPFLPHKHVEWVSSLVTVKPATLVRIAAVRERKIENTLLMHA